jgi:hypothetical protein
VGADGGILSLTLPADRPNYVGRDFDGVARPVTLGRNKDSSRSCRNCRFFSAFKPAAVETHAGNTSGSFRERGGRTSVSAGRERCAKTTATAATLRGSIYRWGEDGSRAFPVKQRLCFALALWNGKNPILKERLFGLTNSEGNHGENVKEYYFYLDSTPTHSDMKHLHK